MPNPLRPVGVGDLLVVKQQIVGYETTEVAFLENILKGELHTREVRRAETTDETRTTETEQVSEEERDLQSTDRFEVRRESEQMASMDAEMRSPAYGGLLEASSVGNAPAAASLQVAERQASTYARDVTNRAVSKVTERARTQIVRRTVREFEEKTAHRFENKDGPGNVTGVYQWVDKIYEHQVYNYGKRLLYDVVVPEPGAFLLQAFARAQSEGRELVKPQPFTLAAFQLTPGNYTYYVSKYEAAGVEPPPPMYLTACKAFRGTPASVTGQPEALELSLPPGYGAYSGYIRLTASPYTDPPPGLPHPCLQIVVSDLGPFRPVFFVPPVPPPPPPGVVPPFAPPPFVSGPLTYSFSLFGATDRIPIVVTSWYITSYAFVIGVTVKVTDDTMAKWQARTHDILLQAYLRKKAEYEERLANLLAALRVGALGPTSTQKRQLEKDELKKSCLTLITLQLFDAFKLIDLVPRTDPVTGETVPYAQMNILRTILLGPFIRFCEQAFEWEQMMHALYSYFWARKDYWMRRVTIEDADEAFAGFLKAGAARVVIPVRPGFEAAVIHYIEKGVIWDGGPVPDINSPLYVPIVAELKAAANAAGAEAPYGDPWRVHLPTTLVQLRADGKLPAWQKVGNAWVPA